MAKRTKTEVTEKNYLLGVLPEEESTRLEDGYFADDELFEEIELQEDELIDAYIRKNLDDRDRNLFEQAMQRSKRLRDRVAFARVLLIKTSKQPVVVPDPSPSRWASFLALFSGPAALKSALAAAIVLVVFGSGFFTVEWRRMRQESMQLAEKRSSLEQETQKLRTQIAAVESEAQKANVDRQNLTDTIAQLKQQLENTEQQLAQTRLQTGSVSTASVALFPASVRAGGVDDLVVQPQDKRIRLDLNLDDDEFRTYRVAIESANSRGPTFPTVRAHGPPSQRVLSVAFRANQLRPGDYVVKVDGRTASGDYDPVTYYRFRLVKK